jgi:hypothetical protein
MSKAIIRFDSLADKRITLEFILRELDKKNINVFERIMQKVERRGYENFID